MVRNKIFLYRQRALTSLLLCLFGLSGCILDGRELASEQTFYHQTYNKSTNPTTRKAQSEELAGSTLSPVGLDLVSLDSSGLDPWGQELYAKTKDPLEDFLRTSESIREEKRTFDREKLKSFLQPSDEFFLKKNYVYETNHRSIQNDQEPISIIGLTLLHEQNFSLDVFAAKLSDDFERQLEQWLQNQHPHQTEPLKQTVKIHALFRIFPDKREKALVGLTESQILSWLNTPDKIRRIGDIVTWQYVEETCVLNVYLYEYDKIPARMAGATPLPSEENTKKRIVTFAESYDRASSTKACEKN